MPIFKTSKRKDARRSARPLSVAARYPVYAMRPDSFTALLPRVCAGDWDDDEAEEMPENLEVGVSGNVAIITINGTLMDGNAEWYWSYYDYVSTPEIREAINAVRMDANITSVILYLNSPGGQASGVADLADAVYALSQAKPTAAYCKDACSAAYWIASQCQKVYVAQDGYAGCIGTLMCIQDWSKFYSEMGITVYRVTSTGAEEYKGEGASGTTITDAQLTDFKRIANAHQSLFNAGIQRGRGFDDETIAALADGRTYLGQSAVDLKLADGVITFGELTAAMGAGAFPEPETDDVDDEGGDDDPAPQAYPIPSAIGQTNVTPAAMDGERRNPMTFMEKLKALVNGEGETTEPVAVAPVVDVAAQIEAGVKAGLLSAKRVEAKAAAVRAFGPESVHYAATVTAIDALPTMEAVEALVSSLNAVTSATFAGATGQQTISTGATMETTYSRPQLQNQSLVGSLLQHDKSDAVFGQLYASLKQKGMVE